MPFARVGVRLVGDGGIGLSSDDDQCAEMREGRCVRALRTAIVKTGRRMCVCVVVESIEQQLLLERALADVCVW